MRLRLLVPPVVALATVWARHAKGAAHEAGGVVHAHACADTTRSWTPHLFCWQACETGETGMNPE